MLHTRRSRSAGLRRLRILAVIKQLGFPCKVRCVPYVDTVVLFFKSLPEGMLKKLRSLLSRKQVFKREVSFGRIVVLHQPTLEALLVAEKYRAEADGEIYRVDFAYDLYCSDLHFDFGNFIRQNVALKFRVRQPIHIVGKRFKDGPWKGRQVIDISNVDRLAASDRTTMYWRNFPTTIVRNLVHYNDREGKVDGGRPEHLELRLIRMKNCRAAGLVTLHDVINANPLLIFERHVEIVKYDFESLFINTVRNTLQQERKKHLSDRHRSRRSTFAEGFVDRYRSSLKNRVSSLIVRSEMQFVQTAKRLITSSGKVKKMSRYPSSIFAIPNKLRWGAKPLASLKYQKKIDFTPD